MITKITKSQFKIELDFIAIIKEDIHYLGYPHILYAYSGNLAVNAITRSSASFNVASSS